MANNLTYALNLDTGGWTKGMAQAQGGLSSLMGSVGSVGSGIIGKMAGIGAAIAGVVVAFKGLQTAGSFAMDAIGEAADRETLQTAFVPLLGSVAKAKDRMGELAKFATATPFQLPGIAKASATLETLTDGALATGKGLTLVGDVASATNKPFDEMAVTIGRLYAGLDSGRPVGEAMASLSQLGAISPQVRNKLEALQKEGKKGSEVWKVAADDLARYSGGMELQSKTWNGKISTLSDAWKELQVQFGQPIMDALSPMLNDGIGLVVTMTQKAKQIGEAIGYGIKFLIEAYKGGEIWDLAKNGLIVAFGEAVNFLWKNFNGCIAVVVQDLIEGFKTAVMMFEIVTEGAFWEGLWATLKGGFIMVFASIEQMLSKIMVNLIDTLSPLIDLVYGGSDRVSNWLKDKFEGGGEMWAQLAKQGQNEAKAGLAQLWDNYGDKVTNRMIERGQNMVNAYNDAFDKAGSIIDVSSEYGKLASLAVDISSRISAADEAKKAAENKEIRKAKPQDSEINPKLGKQTYEIAFAGSLAKVGGGGYGRLISSSEDVGKQQLKEQKTTNDKLETLIKETQKQNQKAAIYG